MRKLAALAQGKGHRGPRLLVARGSAGSSTAFLTAALARHLDGPILLVVAHLDEAEETYEELLGPAAAKRDDAPLDVVRLPALEILPGETGVAGDLLAERIGIVRRLVHARSGQQAMPNVIIAPVQALMQPVPPTESLGAITLSLARNQQIEPGAVQRWLAQAGYERVDSIDEPGQFAVRGGITDIFPVSGSRGAPPPPRLTPQQSQADADMPFRLDFFGSEIESIREIDIDTMASDRALDRVELVCADLNAALGAAGDDAESRARAAASGVSFLEYLPAAAVVVLHELLEVTEQARGYFERVSDGRTIFGPPAVLKALEQFGAGGGGGAKIEVNQFSPGLAAADALVELPIRSLESFARDAAEAVREVAAMGDEPASREVAVFASSEAERSRFGELVDEFAPQSKDRLASAVSYISRGFVWGEEDDNARPLAVVPYHEMLHRFETRRRLAGRGSTSALASGNKLRAGRAIDTFLDFAPGDYVVHREHGIARFLGLTVLKPRAVKKDEKIVLPGEKPKKAKKKPENDPDEGLEEYLTLEFGGRTKLQVPATKIDQVQRYVGGMGSKGEPTLSVIGGNRWKQTKERVAESVRDLAAELLRVRAARETMPGVRYPADTAWQKEFEAEFPYQETDDQLASLSEIKKDMQSDRPMDRLLCGDVGYGKTELAVRAAFKAVEFGKQVAVLVPTTVLAEQHERTFRSRFADYPFRVESLSRFKSTKEINDTLAALRKGHVDVVIGTHRLISKDVKFNDLGLVVIDEEQRFGVEHKERLLALRMTVDVLTLSATPIPRTLHMSMLGLRDISSLSTAPMDRRAVVTEVVPFNERRVQQAINRELARDGQVFFVHNRVHNIESVADDIQRLVPDARIVIGHGQMPDGELEKVMLAFMRRQADILVSTTIIESGIDIATANTMLINDAHRFGLAELHQLRGRVGRSRHRAYCYLLLDGDKPVAEKAMKRLKAIEEFSMLGAGFKIAMRDLEIRGAGNILGPEQSGHIAAVGYEMYCQLLEQAVKELNNEPTNVASETSIELGITGMIPKRSIASDQRRMEAYRRIAVAQTPAEVRTIAEELVQAYGQLAAATQRLLDLAELRTAASGLHVRAIALRGKDVLLRVPPAFAETVADQLRSGPGGVTVLPPREIEESSEVYFRPPESYLKDDAGKAILMALRNRLAVSNGK